MDIRPYALILHIMGFAMWIGTLFGIAGALAARDTEPEATNKAALARAARAQCKEADIGFTLALIGGLAMIFAASEHYAKQPWLHMKLFVVLIVLGLHGFLRVKAKRAVEGTGTLPKAIFPVVSLCALVIVSLVILKPLAR